MLILLLKILEGNCSSWSDSVGVHPLRGHLYGLSQSPCSFFSLVGFSAVILLGHNVLQPLPQHMEGWPGERVQAPAEFHDVVHHLRTAIWRLHRVALLHVRDHIFQRLCNGWKGSIERRETWDKHKSNFYFYIRWNHRHKSTQGVIN